jgi:hypothetical protein
MLKRKRVFRARSLLTAVLIIACGGALAMPFCGNKGGYKDAYYFVPVYAYPPAAPARNPRPTPRPHVHSWDRIGVQSPVDAPADPAMTAVALPASRGR